MISQGKHKPARGSERPNLYNLERDVRDKFTGGNFSRRKPDPAQLNGGIDLNQINVLRNGKKVLVHFDPAQINQLQQDGFEGFTPVITGFQYIKSPFPLLGVKTVLPEGSAKV